ncbi:MAG: hypothetical protein MUE78_08250 [Ilumatobacteraceae bacterium]|nr:hypothetical protein [Ilumatobacteraceae bacterium]
MADEDDEWSYQVIVVLDGETLDLACTGRTAADDLAASVLRAAEQRSTLRLSMGTAEIVVNFDRVARTLVDVVRGAGGAVGIKR